jgi:hypothetical protein
MSQLPPRVGANGRRGCNDGFATIAGGALAQILSLLCACADFVDGDEDLYWRRL